jgi:hypothetical protein
LLSIEAVSFISTIKVDSPIEILSLAPTLSILSTVPILASAAGRKPICAMLTINAVCLRMADFQTCLDQLSLWFVVILDLGRYHLLYKDSPWRQLLFYNRMSTKVLISSWKLSSIFGQTYWFR